MFDSGIKSAIKQVKIPYHNGVGDNGSVASGSSGLSAKVFLLSGYEIGWTTNTSPYLPADGACLDYFEGMAATDSKRIAYYNGSADQWWLRSADVFCDYYAWYVYTNGGIYSSDYYDCTFGVRPALILPSTTLVDDNYNVIA